MYRLLQYLKFICTATNHHGVHSPFIYNYVTKCLYAKPHYRYSKSVNVLLKSIAYFEARQIWFPKNHQLEKTVQSHFPNVRFSERSYKILFMAECDEEIFDTMLSRENSIQNDSLLLIDAIHGNKEKNDAWKRLKMHEKVSVTIDMFHCGAVFFRQEQAKEHFKIRI